MKQRKVGLGLGLSLLLWAGSARAEKDRYEVGETVPVFTLKAVNPDESGEKYVSVDQYFGPDAKAPKKAVVLSFFATYCEPCKKEMPFLAALYDVYREKGLQVMVISIDKEPDKIELLQTLAKEANVTFPVLSDRFNIVAKRYFISKLPNVYVLNSEGKVAMVAVGYNDDISKRMLDEIRKALGESTSDPVPDAIARYMAHPKAEDSAAVAADDGDDKGKRGHRPRKGKGKRR